MVLRVHLEVLGEVRDALGQERDLDLGGPGVARHAGEFLNDLCLLNCGQTHVTLDFSLFFCVSMSYRTPVESTEDPGFFRSVTVGTVTWKARRIRTIPASPGSITATSRPSFSITRIVPDTGAPVSAVHA